jgi:2-polyprenyl-3-methyl-5-hydroxy-6-metoxy-1,4-benzoquinol methylase
VTPGAIGVRRLWSDRLQRQSLFKTAGYWDERAQRLDGMAASMWPNATLNALHHAEQLALVDAWLPDVAGATLLDLGCGTGRVARHLAGRGAKVVGADFAPACIAAAQRLSSGDGEVEYRVQDLFELEDNGRFDAIVTWAVLAVACQTRAELLRALGRLRRALKPGGRLLLGEPIHAGPLHRVLRLRPREYEAALGEAGLHLERTAELHFWPARLVLASLPWPAPLTRLGWRAGARLLRATGRSGLGDYTVVLARADP